MFKAGDLVLYEKTYYTYEVVKTTITNVFALKHSKTKRIYAMPHISRLRLATPEEIAAGHRNDHIVEPNDMGDDPYIENHVSPNCKTESQPVLILERDNQIIERLKAENKMLHEAAATHLRNQKHYMDLYHRLVEQLYPYALDLNEPVVGNVKTTSQEFIDGYNRALECVHYNLLEMMESDVEYICAQCGMLGGGGEA